VTRHFEREAHPDHDLILFASREVHPPHGERAVAVRVVTASLRRTHHRHAVIATGEGMPEPIDERGGPTDFRRKNIRDE
jgi:hypothetical protein